MAWRSLSLVLALHQPAHAQRRHTVQSGQTLGAIAKRYRVSVANLAAANGLKKTSSLRVGQVLRVPPRGRRVRLPRPDSHRHRKAQQDERKSARQGQSPQSEFDPSRRAASRAPRLQCDGQGHEGAQFRSQRAWSRSSVRQARKPCAFGSSTRMARSTPKDARDSRSFYATERPSSSASRTRGSCGSSRRSPTISTAGPSWSSVRIALPSKVLTRRADTRPGEAIDIRVEGVSNEALRDYCLTLRRVGVGYYPREAASSTSTFAIVRSTGSTGAAPASRPSIFRLARPRRKTDGETAAAPL